MEAIEALEEKEEEIIKDFAAGNITNDKLETLYYIKALKGYVTPADNKQISALYKKYLSARQVFAADPNEENRNNLIKNLAAVLTRTKEMLNDIWTSALIKEEREAIKELTK